MALERDTGRRIGTTATYAAVSGAVIVLTLANRTDVAAAIALTAFSGLGASIHRRLSQVQDSVGPKNGDDLHGLVTNLLELDRYQHRRNHDLLNAATPPNASLALLLIALCDHAGIDLSTLLGDPRALLERLLELYPDRSTHHEGTTHREAEGGITPEPQEGARQDPRP